MLREMRSEMRNANTEKQLGCTMNLAVLFALDQTQTRCWRNEKTHDLHPHTYTNIVPRPTVILAQTNVHGVVTASEIVRRIFLATDQLLRMEPRGNQR